MTYFQQIWPSEQTSGMKYVSNTIRHISMKKRHWFLKSMSLIFYAICYLDFNEFTHFVIIITWFMMWMVMAFALAVRIFASMMFFHHMEMEPIRTVIKYIIAHSWPAIRLMLVNCLEIDMFRSWAIRSLNIRICASCSNIRYRSIIPVVVKQINVICTCSHNSIWFNLNIFWILF
jgi:hypothetical protein